MDALYDWLFHYNPHTKSWAAFRREHMQNYFNGDHENVVKSKSQKTLEELIISNEGDLERIHKFVSKLKS
jgi:hypothetical protein